MLFGDVQQEATIQFHCEVINAVDDVANTVLRGKLPIKAPQRKKLRRELTSLKKLAMKKGSLAHKRKLL